MKSDGRLKAEKMSPRRKPALHTSGEPARRSFGGPGSRTKTMYWIPAFAGMTFFFGSSFILASSTLDIGTQYRMRGISLTRTDYGLTANQNYAYYSQRALAHIGGRFSPNIEFMMQWQALSIAGSSGTVITNPI